MVQSLNHRQASAISAMEKRKERLASLEEEFALQLERTRKGKGKADDAMDLGEPPLDPEQELEARILSKTWDFPLDAFSTRSNAKVEDTLRLLEEELSVRTRGNVDDEEERLVQRMEKLEPLVRT